MQPASGGLMLYVWEQVLEQLLPSMMVRFTVSVPVTEGTLIVAEEPEPAEVVVPPLTE